MKKINHTAYLSWAIVSLAIIAATTYLIIKVNPWFILMMLAMPSLTSDKEK